MSEWKSVNLRDLSDDIAYGYTASATDVDTGVKFLRITDIVASVFSWDNVPYCQISQKDFDKYTLDIGDIVIARTGATTGSTFTIRRLPKAVFASYLIRYRINKSIADPVFVGYNLRSEQWSGYVENIIGGSAQPGANAQQFADYELLLPSLEEQKNIAELLSSLDDKIDLLHSQNQTLEQMAEALFRERFADETIELTTVKDEFNVVMGQSPPGNSYNEDKEGVIFYQGRTDFGFRFPSPRVYCTDPSRFAEKGDTLMSVRAPVGDLNYAEEVCCIGRGLAAIRHKNIKVHKSYTFYLLKTLKDQFDVHDDNGTIFGSISKEELLGLKCRKLRPEDIDWYNNTVGPFDEKLVSNCKQIKQLEKTRDALLPKLMSGAIRVRN